MSPSASVSAFLHSIMGASVFARNSATMLAVIAAIKTPCTIQLIKKGAKKGPLEPLFQLTKDHQAFASTSTNSSLSSDATLTISFTALARPSKIASAIPRA